MEDKIISAGSGLTDKEAEEDLLEITEYVNACANFIMNCRTPMSIAIQGGWGTGKSSFMHLVEKALKTEGRYETEAVIVRFNTWQYNRSGEERLFVPLITCLEKKLDEVNESDGNYKKYFSAEERQLFSKKSLLKTLRNAGSTYAGLGGAIAVALGQLLDKDSDGKADEQEDTYDEILQLRDKLQERINVTTGKSVIVNDKLEKGDHIAKKLVVFVDDLDRLAPKDAVNLLEDMKNFMDCDETVFVLALDHNLVNRGVKEKYGDIEDGYENKFFEKIVQLPFFLPTRKYNLRNYVTKLINENDIKNLNPELCVKYIEQFDGRNPRVIKRALNVYQLNSYIMNFRDSKEDQSGLFALILLQMQNENEFSRLVEALSGIMRECPATAVIENSGYEELMKKEGLADTAARLKEVFPYYSQLNATLMKSTFAEAVNSASKKEQLDEIYMLLCEYVREKGFKNSFDSDKQSNWKLDNGHSIQIKRFNNNANINFLNFRNPKEKIDTLLKAGIALPANENEAYFFDSSPGTFIKDSFYLYIRNVTADPQVLKAVGVLVNIMIEEDKENTDV